MKWLKAFSHIITRELHGNINLEQNFTLLLMAKVYNQALQLKYLNT